MKVTAEITDTGMRIVQSDRKRYERYIGKMQPGVMLEIIVTEIRAIRSLEQNSYYWGVIVKMLAEFLGYSPNEMHEVLKYLHNPKEIRLPDGTVVKEGGSTTELDTLEAEKYFEKIRAWSDKSLNFIIPLPNEESNNR